MSMTSSFSRIYCIICLEQFIKVTFPHDVGMEKECATPTVRALSTIVHVGADSHVTVFPRFPNIAFALGMSDTQKVSRLGLFLGSSGSNFMNFAQFVVGQYLSLDRVLLGRSEFTLQIIVIFICEVLFLGYPEV